MKLYAIHLSPDRSRILGNILHVATKGMVYKDLQTKAEHSYLNLAELLKNHPGINPKDLLYPIDTAQGPESNIKSRNIMKVTVNPLGSDNPITFDVYTRDEITFSVGSEEEFFEVAGLAYIDEVFENIVDYLRGEEVDLLEGSREEPVEPKLRVKEFSEVEVGDIAYHVGFGDSPTTADVIGEVIWVGDFRALLYEEEHRELYLTWEVGPAQMLAEYNELVIIRDKDGFNTLYNYNCDPSGARCFTTD